MSKNLFKQYSARLVKEGLLKAFLWGLLSGFAALFVSSFVFWLTKPEYYWIGIVLLVGVTVVVTPIVYFAVYRPNTRGTARRIDALGLEERMVTMTQFEEDQSYIAQRQRADAVSALATVNAKLIKFAVPLSLVITTSVLGVLGVGMGTVTLLSDLGFFPKGKAFIEEILPDEPPVRVSVSYIVLGGGYLEGGDPEQLILQGEDAETVMVVAEDGWIFLAWSDGVMEPTRTDKRLMEDLEVSALLMEVSFLPGESGGPGEGEPGEGEPGEGETGKNDQNSDDPGLTNGASGHYEPSNQIIDGSTYYRESSRYEDCYNEALQILENQGILENGEELPPELRAVLDAYFKGLK